MTIFLHTRGLEFKLVVLNKISTINMPINIKTTFDS